jgi:hypothetical protein
MRLVRAGVLSLLLLSASGAAGVAATEREVLFKLTGQQATGFVSVFDPIANVFAGGSFSSIVLPDGTEALFVIWSTCTSPDPMFPPVCTDNIVGIAPKTAVRGTGNGETLDVDFDSTKLLQVFSSTGPSTWKGRLSRYTGPFSFAMITAGQEESTNVYPDFFNPAGTIKFVQKITGGKQTYSTVFTGTIGSRQISAPPVGPNGNVFTHRGGTMVVTRTTIP